MPARTHRIAVPSPEGLPLLQLDWFPPTKRRQLSGPALRTFLSIADRWRWTEAERFLVLGSPSRSTYLGWVAKACDGHEMTLPVDVLLRISAILGIHKALMILFGSEPAALDWLTGPHDEASFDGQPPMALVTNGMMDGPLLVLRYLDAARGGTFGAPGPMDETSTPFSDDDIVIL